MTENTTTTDQLDPVVPEGVDPLDDLTAGELGHIGKLLRCDPYEAAQGGSERPNDPANGMRWPALAHVVWVWQRRTNPHAKLSDALDLKPAAIAQLLRLGDDELADEQPAADEQDVAENPTDSPHAS